MLKKLFVVGGIVAGIIMAYNPFLIIGIRHLVHMVKPPINLYDPIVIDEYELSSASYTKRYNLTPKYSDFYEVGFLNEDGKIPNNYKFNGVMEIKMYYQNQLISTERISTAMAYTYTKNNNNNIKRVVLKTFPLPLKGTDLNDITLEVKIVEPDESIKLPVKIYVAVSTIP